MFGFNINLKDYNELLNYKKVGLEKKCREIFNVGYKLMYPNLNNISEENGLILSRLDELTRNSPQISDLNKSITQLLGITSNSSKKGEFVEGIVEEYIKEKYSSNSYEVKRSEGHCGDGWLTLDNSSKVMVEVKAYSKTVNECEVEKLRYDMKYNKINFGIMVSLGSRIQNSKLVDLEMFSNEGNNYYIVKLGPVGNNKYLLDIGFDLISKITNIKDVNGNVIILEDCLLNKLNILLEKINQNNNLRDSYNNMMMDVYQKMDSFNQEMTLLFLEQKTIINQIIVEINNNSIHNYELSKNDMDKFDKYSKYKIYNNLLKVLDIIKNKDLKYSLEKDKIKSKKMDIKIGQDKLTISLIEMNLNIILTSKGNDTSSNKRNLELLNSLI